VLRPNGKLCIVAPLLPLKHEEAKRIGLCQHTRPLVDIAGDIGRGIVEGTDLLRYETFVWQKQTTGADGKPMLGAYPFAGNSYANNTIEFINVFAKPGKPPRFPGARKELTRRSHAEHLNLTQQVWFMMPTEINRKRVKGHPAPFPESIPARLIRLFAFPNEIVLDPFVGTGTVCAVAERMGLRWIGIDRVPKYAEMARERVARAELSLGNDFPMPLVSTPKQQSRAELEAKWKSAADFRIVVPKRSGIARRRRRLRGKAGKEYFHAMLGATLVAPGPGKPMPEGRYQKTQRHGRLASGSDHRAADDRAGVVVNAKAPARRRA
jgi:hypothetical protein